MWRTTSINISVKKNSNIPNDSAEIVNFHFSHYKSIETISCHSNQSSYPTGIKNVTFPCNMERIRLTASEEMHTCDISQSCRVFPILNPFTRRSSRWAKSPAFSILLSVFFADRPIFMSTVVYGIVFIGVVHN